jgi:hypothetical protein
MVTVGGETTTSSIPIQVIDDSSTPTYPVPTACSTPNGTVVPPANNLNELGANAILGVGGLKFDCGDTICPAADDFYYSCPSSGACTAVSVSGSSQVTNPVALFADNNGIAISLPSPASTGSPSLSGAMYFGIGTQTNNTLPSTASVLTLDSTYEAFITTSYKGTSNSTSFIDSGSNGYFFVDSTIPDCINTTSEPYMSDWFCPGSTLSLSATNTGANGTTNTVSFSVANTNTLFNNTTATAYSNLAGTGQTGSFDWGLPFFYGRTVYTAMQGTTSTDTSGVSHAGPFFAY